MARNMEVKARVRDVGDVERTIRDLTRAEPHVMHQEDTFYRVPRGRLKVRHDEHGESAVVYYLRADTPGPILSRYFRRRLDDAAATMDELGRRYGVKAVVRKQRKLFMSGSTRIHLDCVEGLGDFVEIEVPVASMCQKATAANEARNLMRQLGIEPCDVLACAYEDLLAANERT
ncbi:MAG: class IV adenylate cyclase [Planctomycetes bacterium]|nr:class IV adenylate cyclase [Planctomycetota bacterium]